MPALPTEQAVVVVAPHPILRHAQLAQALLHAVRAQDFGDTADALRGGRPLAHFPSIDLAVVAFPQGTEPGWANVLFSREHPRGIVADIGDDASAVRNLRFLADQRDQNLDSIAWLPGSDWSAMRWQTLHGDGPFEFVAPYPASLLKMLVAVGVAMAVDQGLARWPEQAMQRMITLSDNEATDEMVALLHRCALVDALHERLLACGLPTLRLRGTQPGGGWRNADGAGVGMIHMTAWDSARLMWLLDAAAPAPPWLPAGTRLVSDASRERLRGWLQAQQLGEILSSTSLAGVPGWVPGIPADLRFAHKTGCTDNYASDAGIVQALAPQRRHYLVAVLTSLGRRYAPDARCATTWRLPALGAAIDALLARWLEAAA